MSGERVTVQQGEAGEVGTHQMSVLQCSRERWAHAR